jgi:hypothetical protein
MLVNSSIKPIPKINSHKIASRLVKRHNSIRARNLRIRARNAGRLGKNLTKTPTTTPTTPPIQVTTPGRPKADKGPRTSLPSSALSGGRMVTVIRKPSINPSKMTFRSGRTKSSAWRVGAGRLNS